MPDGSEMRERPPCDTLGIAGPVVYGHSLGGFVAMVYAARHPGHA